MRQGQVDEIASSHEITLSEEQFNKIRTIPFQIQGRRPLVRQVRRQPDRDQQRLRQGATFVHDIEIPDPSRLKVPVLSPVDAPANRGERAGQGHEIRPFQFGDKLYVPNVPARYSFSASMPVYHQVIFPANFTGAGWFCTTRS